MKGRIRIGVIAEDQSDVDVLEALIRKIKPSVAFHIKKFLGYGCGKVRSKCAPWSDDLYGQGCKFLVLVHDLDDFDVTELREELQGKLADSRMKKRVVVIPIREIEAWLLADETAIKEALNLPTLPKRIPSPEYIQDPKSKLGEIVYRCSEKKKNYLNTKDNKKIAEKLRVTEVRRCPAFHVLQEFIDENLS